MILAYFAAPEEVGKWMLQNIQAFFTVLESYLEVQPSAMSAESQQLLLKMLHLFVILSRDEKLTKELYGIVRLHLNLYKAVKFSDPVFSNQNTEKQWSSDPRLLQTIVILIQAILADQTEPDRDFV